MKARPLRQFIIHYLNLMLNIFVVLNKENELFLCLRISKMLSFRVFDRCELAFLVCFSCVLCNLNARFIPLSLRKALIPHFLMFCRFRRKNQAE